MILKQHFKGCILIGAIGDALGSGYENQVTPDEKLIDLWGNPIPKVEPKWQLTDDTQLTLATAEAIIADPSLQPESFAQKYVALYRKGKIKGIGASTLKAMRELDLGGHWSQVGRRGEWAAGNGAAMRVAPIAFCPKLTESQIKDICSITHHNDEAYAGALSVILAIKAILHQHWMGQGSLIDHIYPHLPDTLVKDRLGEINQMTDLKAIGEMGNSGYVVHSVPLAIAAASQVIEIGLENMFHTLIDIGGDTDTNCSIAGQIVGALIGGEGFPNHSHLVKRLKGLEEYEWIQSVIERMPL